MKIGKPKGILFFSLGTSSRERSFGRILFLRKRILFGRAAKFERREEHGLKESSTRKKRRLKEDCVSSLRFQKRSGGGKEKRRGWIEFRYSLEGRRRGFPMVLNRQAS